MNFQNTTNPHAGPLSRRQVIILKISFPVPHVVLEWLGWDERVEKPGCHLMPEAPRRLLSLCGIDGGVWKVGGVLAEVEL